MSIDVSTLIGDHLGIHGAVDIFWLTRIKQFDLSQRFTALVTQELMADNAATLLMTKVISLRRF